jgi:RNA polymerase sigma-70 factor (ECF subfamily)
MPATGANPGQRDATSLAATFEAERPFLRRVGYAITGSLTEAEDCVQEAWLRLQRAPKDDPIRDLHAWLTTTVSRLALDALDSARARREQYVGDWLPEPSVAEDRGDPASAMAVGESVNLALLILLERLSPAERAAFLLHDVFGMGFEEVGRVLDRSTVAVRQLASRARSHIEADRPRFPPSVAEQRELLRAFLAATERGDFASITALLAPGVVLRSDAGGKVKAAGKEVRGALKVGNVLRGLALQPPRAVRIALVNGAPGLVLRDFHGVLTVVAVTVDGGRFVAIDVMRNPEKLRGIPEP